MIAASFRGIQGEPWDTLGAMIPAGLFYVLIFLSDVFAVVWAGMWFGLSSKKESQAATKTVLWVLVAPLFALLLWCPGYLFFVGSSIFWIVWARSQLYKRLRE